MVCHSNPIYYSDTLFLETYHHHLLVLYCFISLYYLCIFYLSPNVYQRGATRGKENHAKKRKSYVYYHMSDGGTAYSIISLLILSLAVPKYNPNLYREQSDKGSVWIYILNHYYPLPNVLDNYIFISLFHNCTDGAPLYYPSFSLIIDLLHVSRSSIIYY